MNLLRSSSRLCAGLLASAAMVGGAMAQEMTPPPASAADASPATQTTPMEPQKGVTSAQAVDPAPGAAGPYVGHSENAFYDVDARIGRVQQRISSSLTGVKLRNANRELASIKSELATQKARHGDVRDWDRENITKRLDALEGQYGLGAAASAG